MTIDSSKLVIGSKFYGVRERNHVFHRDKIHQVIDGEDWFRYSDPLREYNPEYYVVLGIMHTEVTVTGQWPRDKTIEPHREFYVNVYCRDWMETSVIDIYNDDEYFHTLAEQAAQITLMEAQCNAMELNNSTPKDE